MRLGYHVFVVIDDNKLKLGDAQIKAKNAEVSLIQIEPARSDTLGACARTRASHVTRPAILA